MRSYKQFMVSNRFLDLEGKRFGRLLVIEMVGKKRNLAIWKCKCDCGNEVERESHYLTKKQSPSCGCWAKENHLASSSTHQLSCHPLYRVWQTMKNRCHSPSVEKYKSYGERGIKVCDAWYNYFQLFYDWAISNGWRKGLTIERKNNDGNYEPSNCIFAEAKVQARNTRRTKLNIWKARVARKLRNTHNWRVVDIARIFSVSEGVISEAIANRTWLITESEIEQEHQRIISQSQPVSESALINFVKAKQTQPLVQ